MATKKLDKTGLSQVWSKIVNLFVAKEAGKGLSTNDFTNEYKTQLENLVTTGGEVNVLEGVTVDGTDLDVNNKRIALGKLSVKDEVTLNDLATALQTIINNKADAATTLAGYGITDAMTATEIAQAIATAVAGADHMKRKIVASTSEINLTASDASQYIYMVSNASSTSGNLYDEYMVINGALEKVGDWEVDLSEYLKAADLTDITTDEINEICVMPTA